MKNLLGINKKLNNRGQSTIEFILTVSVAVGITTLFISLAINYMIGFLVHFGVFMSSRAYLTHDIGSNVITTSLSSAKTEAERVFNKYNIGSITSIEELKVLDPESGVKPLFVGVTARFKRRVSFVDFISGPTDATLLSESLLGKEPLRAECLNNICALMGVPTPGSGCANLDVTLYDNGC